MDLFPKQAKGSKSPVLHSGSDQRARARSRASAWCLFGAGDFVQHEIDNFFFSDTADRFGIVEATDNRQPCDAMLKLCTLCTSREAIGNCR
jgi:hypothetical protein